MAEYDVIIKNGNIYGGGLFLQKNMDMAVKDGKIAAIDKSLGQDAELLIDATDKLISPGFVDSDINLDTAFLKEEDADGAEQALYSDIMERASKVVDMCILHGTTTLKCMVSVNKTWKMTALQVMIDLKKKYKNKIDILNAVPYMEEFGREWRKAARNGDIDFVGGSVNTVFSQKKDYKAEIDRIFALAKEYDLPISIHCDESDEPDTEAFLYVIAKTMEEQYQRRVTCGHVTALGAIGISEDTANDTIVRAARAQVYVTTQTSSDLYRMDWKRRGPTRVRDLFDSGVGISIASGSIQNRFHPFGNANLLEEALLTANIHKYATHEELSKIFDMITYQPALNSLIEGYGILPGCKADLVVIAAKDMTDAILSKAQICYVLKNGKVTAANGDICRKEQP